MGQESVSQPSLVLVAPMPRRPIALVARRSNHHHSHSHSSSRSRSSRSTTSTSTVSPSAGISSQGSTPILQSLAAGSAQINSPDSASYTSSTSTSLSRYHGHPYSRAKTPSNSIVASASLSPLVGAGLGLCSATSPLLQDLTGLRSPPRDGIHARPRKSLRDAFDEREVLPTATAAPLDSAQVLPVSEIAAMDGDDPMAIGIASELAAEGTSADQPSVISPVLRASAFTSSASGGRTSSDVDRTPTKKALKELASRLSPSDDPEDEDPKSTPTLGPDSPRSSAALLLSPQSPSVDRTQSTTSNGRSALPAALSLSAAGINNVSSVTPSPSLSESRSRSPSASPSPCPSPTAHEGRDKMATPAPQWLEHHDEAKDAAALSASAEDDAEKYLRCPVLLEDKRKLGLPMLIPTSPIPRKMTRNPFERYLSFHAHQRLQQHVHHYQEDGEDEIMRDRAASACPSPSPVRPSIQRAGSSNIDMEVS